MNLPKRAEDAHSALAAAFNTGDLATVLSMYDTSGVIVPEPGKPVSGRQEFEEAVKAILAIKGRMEIKTVYCLQTGNLAVGRSEWNITDGDEVKVKAKGVELMKQGEDGIWKILIDHAFGAEADLIA
ncbi:YybH family protein [Pedobacter vanadiisoli]|uniref:YybH family protein n=1 Tax=Pedobacter vanadiisoli TaxID=1761975 RepID=A0ABW5MFR5_9SPHI